MFIDMMAKRNPALVQAAVELHQAGTIAPNTHLIDLDALEANARHLAEAAKENGMNLYYMTKQIGRSGFIGRQIEKQGVPKAVAVDIDEADLLRTEGCEIGNLGHLVQPGKMQWNHVLTQLNPEVVTLFSLERAEQLSEEATKLGYTQDVILRVIQRGDFLYPGQYGGFLLDELPKAVLKIKGLPGIQLVGVTSFPVLQYTKGDQDFTFSSNAETVKQARAILKNADVDVTHVNTPSATSVHTIPMLKELGATHGEPGHALTGTTPLHAYREDLKEVPAIVYVSEISHQDRTHAYTIAGGFYPRSNMKQAFYGNTRDEILMKKAHVDLESIGNIDYYGALKRNSDMAVGDTVVYAYRTQVFVTRSHVAFVRGIKEGKPEVVFSQKRGS
ncbi:YhfX family PLP-dependent enzyme [Shouchella shacheensis]|uniref:YhfX family PLP-dependent enzyme n=1 Tax=Shouchella shacheensis TaxID=1649580 RepID=UPI00073FBDF8|nr:YhfX family PLP-dependent enzyme [Shouchella shacheensis]